MVKLKRYVVTLRNRYYPLEGDRKVCVLAASKTEARQAATQYTDEYRVIRSEVMV